MHRFSTRDRQARAHEAQLLQRIDSRQPELAMRLRWPSDGTHIVEAPRDGPVEYRVHSKCFPLSLHDDQVATALAHAGDATEVCVFGLGLGELAEAAIRDTSVRRVIAWDRDPWLVRRALTRCPGLVDAVHNGRLEIALGIDIMNLRGATAQWPRVDHPLLANLYALEHAYLETAPRTRRALLVSGGLFVDDLADTLRDQIQDAAFDVLPLEADRWSTEELSFALQRFAPDVVFAVNHREGMAEFCSQHAVPLVVWEIDPSVDREVARCTEPGSAHVFTWRRAQVEAFRHAGFPSVQHLPLASNPERRTPPASDAPELVPLRCDVAFVGASLRANAQAHRARFLEVFAAWAPEARRRANAEAALEEILAAQEAAQREWILPSLLQDRFADFLAAWEASNLREDPVLLVAEAAGARYRAGALASLAALEPRVWGDAGWKAIPGVRWMGPAGHHQQLSNIYAASAINVDVGRPYQLDITTMRVFDALLCGGFVLAEDSEDLHDLFEVGVEIETWGSFTELASKAKDFLADPERARTIAERGRRACLERHTIRQRVEEMLEVALPTRPRIDGTEPQFHRCRW